LTNIFFKGQQYALLDKESVLDCLLRNGHRACFGCRAGVCQSCILALDSSDAVEDLAGVHRMGLTGAQKQLSYFLPCQSYPTQDIAVCDIEDTGNEYQAVVLEKRWLNKSVIQLKLQADLDYHPGQFVTLWRNEYCARSYSLASIPVESAEKSILEFHIKHIPDGAFSGWLSNCIEPGDSLRMRGAMGSFIYSSDSLQPLVLCAMGTGLAPILGIIKTALDQGHRAAINLLLAAKNSSEFYMLDELSELAQRHDNLNLHCLAQSLDHSSPYRAPNRLIAAADIYQYCANRFPDTADYHYYLCGAESFVKKMRKQLFLAGAALDSIKADAFIASG
jgi:NAD(P)H-flavin reductase/ferredoxin